MRRPITDNLDMPKDAGEFDPKEEFELESKYTGDFK